MFYCTFNSFFTLFFPYQDDLYEGFLQKGHFPGPTVSIPRRPHDLLMFFFWFVLLALPLFWYLGSIFMSGTFTQQAVVVLVVVLGIYQFLFNNCF